MKDELFSVSHIDISYCVTNICCTDTDSMTSEKVGEAGLNGAGVFCI